MNSRLLALKTMPMTPHYTLALLIATNTIICRGRSWTAATSKMEHFVIIVNA